MNTQTHTQCRWTHTDAVQMGTEAFDEKSFGNRTILKISAHLNTKSSKMQNYTHV